MKQPIPMLRHLGAAVLSALVAVTLWMPTVVVPSEQARLAVANVTVALV